MVAYETIHRQSSESSQVHPFGSVQILIEETADNSGSDSETTTGTHEWEPEHVSRFLTNSPGIKEDNETRRKQWFVFVIFYSGHLILSVSVTGCLMLLLNRLEKAEAVTSFETFAVDFQDALVGKIDRASIATDVLASTYEAVGELSYESFLIISSTVLSETKYLTGIGWIPMVPHSSRIEIEQLGSQVFNQNYTFKTPTYSEQLGRMILHTALEQEIYAPLVYATPYAVFRNALGYNMLAERARGDAVRLALKLRAPTLTERLALVSTAEFTRYGFIQFSPVFQYTPEYDENYNLIEHSNSANLTSLVSSVFNWNTIAQSIVGDSSHDMTEFQDIEVYIFDQSANSTSSLALGESIRGISNYREEQLEISNFVSIEQVQSQQRNWRMYSRIFTVKDRNYIILLVAPQRFLESRVSYLTWFAPLLVFLGLLLTSIVSGIAQYRVNQKIRDNFLLSRAIQDLRAIVEAIPDPMIVFDEPTLKILDCNRALAELSGYEETEICGKLSLVDLFGTSLTLDSQPGKARLRSVVQLTTKIKTGKVIWGEAHCSNPTELQRRVCIVRDLTKLRDRETRMVTAAKQAEASSKSKEDFLAFLCHELRNPIHSLLGLLELLSPSENLGARDKECIDSMRFCASTMKSLVTDVLDLSKIQKGKQPIEKIPFDLLRLMQDLDRSYRPLAEVKGIEWKLVIFESPQDQDCVRALVGDPTKLRQILENLASNAVKYTLTGHVEIKVTKKHFDLQKRSIGLHFTVQDTGIGMSKEFLPLVFSPFERDRRNAMKRFEGTGLGLNIVKELVTIMGGTISVTSDEGKGSLFQVDLNFDMMESGGVALRDRITTDDRTASQVEQKIRDLHSHYRILFVEDNAVNRKIFKKYFQSFTTLKDCITLEEAINGQEAVDRVIQVQDTTEKFDIVFMDINMPVMNGIEATERIRKAGYTSVPIIALTGNALDEYRNACQVAQMNDFITKPFTREQILNIVLLYLSKPTTQSTESSPG